MTTRFGNRFMGGARGFGLGQASIPIPPAQAAGFIGIVNALAGGLRGLQDPAYAGMIRILDDLRGQLETAARQAEFGFVRSDFQQVIAEAERAFEAAVKAREAEPVTTDDDKKTMTYIAGGAAALVLGIFLFG